MQNQQLYSQYIQHTYKIYCKLLYWQCLQNLSSVIRILSYEPNTSITAWLYNQNNQLLNAVDNQFTYDANGNQVEEKDSSGQLQKQSCTPLLRQVLSRIFISFKQPVFG